MRSGLAIGMVISAITVIGAGAALLKTQEPRSGIGLPYKSSCMNRVDSCAMCFLYMKQALHDKDPARYSDAWLLAEIDKAERWSNTFCRDTVPDPCRGLRNVRYDASAKFSVHRVVRRGAECDYNRPGLVLFSPNLERGRTMRNKFEVVLRPTLAQLAANDISVHEDPLWLDNGLYWEWEKDSPDEVAPSDYGIVMPSGIDGDERTWRFLPLRSGLKSDVVEGLPASAFNDAGGSGSFSTHVSRAVVCDPTARLVEVKGGSPGTIARFAYGTYLKQPFLFGDGYTVTEPLETYRPVMAGDATGPIVQSLIRAPFETGPLDGEIELWLKKGEGEPGVIKAALQQTDFLRKDPKSAIGNPQTGASYSAAAAQTVAASEPNKLDYLFSYRSGYYVRRGGNPGPLPVHWFGQLGGIEETGHLFMLAIADPNVHVITSEAEHDSIPNVLVFTYGSSKDKVYSWTWESGEAPTQRLLVDGAEQRFKLTDERLSAYVEALNEEGTNSAEDSLFLGMALGHIKKDEVVWLDWFPESDRVENRLVLCAAGPVQRAGEGVTSVALRRIGVGRSGVTAPLSIKLTDGGNEPMDIAAFQKRYSASSPWKRQTFYDEVLAYPASEDYWLSLVMGKVGIVTTFRSNRYIKVLLEDQSKRYQFGPDLWESVRSKIARDGLIHVAGTPPGEPVSLLRSCLMENHKWDRTRWRANPLGYFDRVLNTRL